MLSLKLGPENLEAAVGWRILYCTVRRFVICVFFVGYWYDDQTTANEVGEAYNTHEREESMHSGFW